MIDLNTKIKQLLVEYGKDILVHPNMQKEKELIQHFNVNCYEHSLAVAYLSVSLAYKFNVEVDMRSLIRGALLHDYFLYDWHEKDESHKLHGFSHAMTALKNASKDFELNEIEEDIIKKHMFPLNIALPRYKESVLVTMADKICAAYEVSRNLSYIKEIRDLEVVYA
ncbi:MAG: HD domain-containing protein [Tissierellia bacterium]|nr:HD domain-containing protein [Tissierellia bacterium]